MKKSKVITILIIIAILAFSFYILKKDKTHDEVNESFAKCLGGKSTIYVQTGCHACQQQEEMFGENYKYLTEVNCLEESLKCNLVEIRATPTWIINGERYEGVQSIEKLKEITGC